MPTASECGICSKMFEKSFTLYRHLREVHGMSTFRRSTNIICQEPQCTSSFNTVAQLREHLAQKHGFQQYTQVAALTFTDLNEFKEWLQTEEKQTQSQFINPRGGRKRSECGRQFYYDCHRSGQSSAVEPGKRRREMRTLGTCKIGYYCTAQIKVIESEDGVHVTYYKNHYRHENMLERQQLLLNKKQGTREHRSNMTDLVSQHRSALSMKENCKKTKNNEWEVYSSTSSANSRHTVKRIEHTCDDASCIFFCKQCHICNKEFVCTCHDYSLRGMCKHIHVVFVTEFANLQQVSDNMPTKTVKYNKLTTDYEVLLNKPCDVDEAKSVEATCRKNNELIALILPQLASSESNMTLDVAESVHSHLLAISMLLSQNMTHMGSVS